LSLVPGTSFVTGRRSSPTLLPQPPHDTRPRVIFICSRLRSNVEQHAAPRSHHRHRRYRRDPRRAAGPRAHIILPIPVRSLPYVLHPPSLPSMAPHVLHAVSDVPLCCPLPMRPEAGRALYRPRTGTGLPSPPPRALHTAHTQDITRHDATLRLRASCVQHTQPLHPAHLASVHALFRCSAKIELPPYVSLRRSPPSRVAASRMDQW
jgi:hypothetical protein